MHDVVSFNVYALVGFFIACRARSTRGAAARVWMLPNQCKRTASGAKNEQKTHKNCMLCKTCSPFNAAANIEMGL
jgi:hypothetical protein